MEILEKLTQRELVNTECLIIKICFKFLPKTAGVCDHLKFTWHCWTGERKVLYAVWVSGSMYASDQ